MSTTRFCFKQDEGGHWYLIPTDLAVKFDRLVNTQFYLEADNIKFIKLFSEYRISHPEEYNFSSPTHIRGINV